MKKTICMFLALLLLLTGCQASAGETTGPIETTVAPTETNAPETTEAETVPEVSASLLPQGGEIAFVNPGKARIDYTGNRSSVQYITCVEDLPDEESLQGYDEAFFQQYALLVVVETVTSGSVQLEIESIETAGDTASVCIKRTMSGDVGTTDMATWLLWAEVEKGLDYTWRIKDRVQPTGGVKY